LLIDFPKKESFFLAGSVAKFIKHEFVQLIFKYRTCPIVKMSLGVWNNQSWLGNLPNFNMESLIPFLRYGATKKVTMQLYLVYLRVQLAKFNLPSINVNLQGLIKLCSLLWCGKSSNVAFTKLPSRCHLTVIQYNIIQALRRWCWLQTWSV
jgi:hypothetical protein